MKTHSTATGMCRILLLVAVVVGLSACSSSPKYAEYNAYIPGNTSYVSDGSDYFGGSRALPSGNTAPAAGYNSSSYGY